MYFTSQALQVGDFILSEFFKGVTWELCGKWAEGSAQTQFIIPLNTVPYSIFKYVKKNEQNIPYFSSLTFPRYGNLM